MKNREALQPTEEPLPPDKLDDTRQKYDPGAKRVFVGRQGEFAARATKKRRIKEAREVQKIAGENADRIEKERFRKILDKRLRGE